MNLMHFLPYDTRGGAETFAVDLIKQQLKNKKIKKIFLLTFQTNSNEIPFSVEINSTNFQHKNISYMPFFLNHLYVIFNLLYYIVKNNIHIVHSHLFAAIYCSFFVFLKNIKFVHTVHNQASMELGTNKKSLYFLLRKFYYNNSNVISISKSVKKSIYAFYNIQSQLILNGGVFNKNRDLDIIDKLFTDNSSLIFLAVGNTRSQKNFNLLIDSFKKINNNNFKLIILGALVDDFKNIDLEFYVKQNIHFLGSVNNVQDYMKIANFLCMPSKYEGMPITLIEAFANGLVPIVTPAPGIVDMVLDSINGFVSNDFSLESYSDCMLKAISSDKKIINRLSDKCVNDYENIYCMEICETNYFKSYYQ
jgi:glycosyltransferase involved in cell wall biosynthesis